MTDTKREPLLSDLEWEHLLDAADVQSGMASKIIVDGVEAAHAMSMDRYDALIKALMYDLGRANDAGLIQRLVDALWNETETHEGFLRIQDVIEAAAAAGFKPSND